MKSIALSADWDLFADASGNIASIDGGAALAQDTATAIRLFQGELWYNTVPGVPYWAVILGKTPSASLMKAKFVAAAMTVPGVVAAKCFISSIVNRKVSGQVQVTDKAGTTIATSF